MAVVGLKLHGLPTEAVSVLGLRGASRAGTKRGPGGLRHPALGPFLALFASRSPPELATLGWHWCAS